MNGNWSMSVSLGHGAHALHVVQRDAAGNESAASPTFALTVTPPPAPSPEPAPTLMIDGVPVVVSPSTLPGGVPGTSVQVPVISADRPGGTATVVDIPLIVTNGQTQLLARVPVDFGLSSAGALVDHARGTALPVDAIRAATPGHPASDRGHLIDNSQSFAAGREAGDLLVSTVRPLGNPGADGSLILDGVNPIGGPGTALVIDAGAMAGVSVELANVDFAAVIGSASVLSRGAGAVLVGDGASQHFMVGAGGASVFAGGGADVLGFGLPTAVGSATTLHGGLGADVASFAGNRDDFDIAFHNGYAVVNSKAAPHARALVVNVEQLRFSDGVVVLGHDAGLETLAGMYQNLLGRQADLDGFAFWADRHDDGIGLGAIALALISSSERVAGHGGFNGDAANDVGLLYQALFKRAADEGGLAFWTAAMQEHGMSLEQVADSFVEAVEMVGYRRAAADWDFSV